MPIFDGVVVVDDDRVPVIVGIEEDGVRLSANGTEIGQWSDGEYEIGAAGDGRYHISADGDTLVFVPHRPELFGRALGQPTQPESVPAHTESDAEKSESETAEGTGAPPPRPMTRALFYTLAGTTAFLGSWALLRLLT